MSKKSCIVVLATIVFASIFTACGGHKNQKSEVVNITRITSAPYAVTAVPRPTTPPIPDSTPAPEPLTSPVPYQTQGFVQTPAPEPLTSPVPYQTPDPIPALEPTPTAKPVSTPDTSCIVSASYDADTRTLTVGTENEDGTLVHGWCEQINEDANLLQQVRVLVFDESVLNVYDGSVAEKLPNVEEIIFKGRSVYVGEEAFLGHTNVTTVTFEDFCLGIKQRAFADCENLREVNLLAGAHHIEGDAFEGTQLDVAPTPFYP